MIRKLALAMCLTTLSVSAADKRGEDLIKEKLSGFGISTESVQPSPLKSGLLQVMTDKGLFYFSEDGRYLVNGAIIDMDTREDIREEVLGDVRLKGLAEYDDSMIVYKAKDEKYKITVFTDITCGYCRKLHREMESYNDLGITVRYLAFPRGGERSQSFSDMEKIWCSEDKQSAMNAAKNNGVVNGQSCKTKVGEHYNFGIQVGVNATPAIVFDNGQLIPGYQSADELIKTLQSAK